MAAVSWNDSLEMCSSEHDVIALVREFVAGLGPYEVEQLPAKLRPGKFFGAADVTAYAFEIVRYDCEEDEARQLVHRIAAFFSQASNRLSRLMAGHAAQTGTESPQRSDAA